MRLNTVRCALTALMLIPSLVPVVAADIVISQVYGGGGSPGALFTHDYVELFNPTDSPVTMTNWSLQYGSFSGNFNIMLLLNDTIPAHSYYLVELDTTGSNGAALPTPDATANTNINAANGKMLLYSTNVQADKTTISTDPNAVDLVGYGTADTFEGSGPGPAMSITEAILRADGGCIDTGESADDFAAGTPAPRNSSSPTNECSASVGEWLLIE